MSVTVGLIVLTAALFHATWNALVKGAADRVIMLGLIALGHLLPGLALAVTMPPPDPAALPWLVASVVVHWGYFWLLNLGYRLGDLSLIYPLARGLAPVLVALVAQLWLGEALPAMAWAGILLVSGGIMVLTRGVIGGAVPPAAVWAALAIGGVVAIYTLIDGVGVRLSGHALGYIGWLFSTKILIVLFVFPPRMARLRAVPARQLWIGFLGGLVSSAAYALVLYAKTLAPLGIVSALRETSVIFAAMIGVLWFQEGPRGQRVLAAIIVAGGIILIGLAS